jgi:archaellum component FlaC
LTKPPRRLKLVTSPKEDSVMNDTELLAAIGQILDEKLEPIKSDISDIKEQLEEIDTSIGMLADWADNVATVTKVPFASGSTSII